MEFRKCRLVLFRCLHHNWWDFPNENDSPLPICDDGISHYLEDPKQIFVICNDIQFIGDYFYLQATDILRLQLWRGRCFRWFTLLSVSQSSSFCWPISVNSLRESSNFYGWDKAIKYLLLPSMSNFSMLDLQAFVRRCYYTGSLRKVRKTVPAQVRKPNREIAGKKFD